MGVGTVVMTQSREGLFLFLPQSERLRILGRWQVGTWGQLCLLVGNGGCQGLQAARALHTPQWVGASVGIWGLELRKEGHQPALWSWPTPFMRGLWRIVPGFLRDPRGSQASRVWLCSNEVSL